MKYSNYWNIFLYLGRKLISHESGLNFFSARNLVIFRWKLLKLFRCDVTIKVINLRQQIQASFKCGKSEQWFIYRPVCRSYLSAGNSVNITLWETIIKLWEICFRKSDSIYVNFTSDRTLTNYNTGMQQWNLLRHESHKIGRNLYKIWNNTLTISYYFKCCRSLKSLFILRC